MKSLPSHIIKKYNNLFKEITNYYEIPNIEIHRGAGNLSVVYADYLGYNGTLTTERGYKDFVEFLKNSRKYLVPFYRFYFSNVSMSGMIFSDITFKQMNKCIRDIRKVRGVGRGIGAKKKYEDWKDTAMANTQLKKGR